MTIKTFDILPVSPEPMTEPVIETYVLPEVKPMSTQLTFSGKIIDSATGQPVQFATVSIYTGGGKPILSFGTTADANGNFFLSGANIGYPNIARFTQAEYETIDIEMDYEDFTGAVVKMKRRIKELDPVTVTSGSKFNYAWLLLIPLGIAATNKKKVGNIGFNVPTVLTAGALFLLIKGGGLINSVFSALGLGTDKDDRDYSTENSNPLSPLKPEIYLAATTAQKVGVQMAFNATELGQELLDSFGAFNDNEAQAIGVFKKFRSQLQSSYFAHIWEKEWNYPDLLQWLKGDGYPNDRLDTGEINEILKYLKNLPKY